MATGISFIWIEWRQADKKRVRVFETYGKMSGRSYDKAEGYCHEDADTILILLGSSYETAREAVDELRSKGKKAGIVTVHALRPFPCEEVYEYCKKCLLPFWWLTGRTATAREAVICP